jgi:hypothetical protein
VHSSALVHQSRLLAWLGLVLSEAAWCVEQLLDLQAKGRDDGMFKGEALGLRAMYGEVYPVTHP